MSESPPNSAPLSPTEATIEKLVKQEIEQEEERHRLFTAEQFLAMQHIAQDVANTQFKRVAVATSNVIISVVALLSSALGLVTALAWNKAVTDWLATAPFFDNNTLAKEFVYAGALTIFGVMAIGILGLATRRLRGKNLLDS
ncbi:MAG: hypothetical protein H0X24_02400 [Ktedonobacterales bacterium]|nr:hypothetical protein [Ktedonobacterales bacterium]